MHTIADYLLKVPIYNDYVSTLGVCSKIAVFLSILVPCWQESRECSKKALSMSKVGLYIQKTRFNFS